MMNLSKSTKVVDKSLKGIAGTHYVAAELSRRGYVTLMTSEYTKLVDLLVANVKSNKTALIQVKTSYATRNRWQLSDKNESWIGDNLFYAFVYFTGSETPSIYIVPSKIVADHITKLNQNWLATPGKKGQGHKANPMRHFYLDKNIPGLDTLESKEFRSNFDILSLE
jgi:hypothetical protein